MVVYCPNETVYFHSRSYHTLSPKPDGHVFDEHTPSRICIHALGNAAADIRSGKASDVPYNLAYKDEGVTIH